MDTPRLTTRGEVTYAEGSPPGAYDPAARLRVMDAEGIDAVLLYPTIGICWEGHVTDGPLATAYTRAYNRWLAEFCRADPKRLFPVAHISLLDPEGAVEETIRARREGCVGIYLSPDLAARAGRHFDDPIFARFWETAQDLEMPVGFHVVVRDRQWFRQWQRHDPSDGLFSFAFLAIDVMAAFTQILPPACSSAIRDYGASSSRRDRTGSRRGSIASITSTASSPIRRRPACRRARTSTVNASISADPDESLTAQMVLHLGADYFVWASDYPHIDASFGVVRELKERLAPLPEEARRKVLGPERSALLPAAGVTLSR